MPSAPLAAFLARTRTHALPHEWAFGGGLMAMTLVLAGDVGGQLITALFATYTAVSTGLIAWCTRLPTALRWRLRLLWYPCAMGLAFYSLPTAISVLGRPNADALLAQADLALLGAPVAERLGFLLSPLVTDALLLAYLFFFWVLIAGPGWYCLKDLSRFRLCIVGLFTVYALGFAGYVLLPAGGPVQFLTTLPPLPEGPIARLLRPVVAGASNGVDVFPSIHFAASAYLLAFDFEHHRARFWRWLLPVLLLWLSTVYLRYHYLVDLLAGVAVAAVGLAAAQWQARREVPFIAGSWAAR